MNGWTDVYQKTLPNASLVMDVSPWLKDLKSWSSKFRNFDYGGMVGRRFGPSGDGSVASGVDGKSYKYISSQIGKKLIINDAHGPGGIWLQYNREWENKEIVQNRFNDGIVAVIQPPTDIIALSKIADQ
jgi:hypothetical protein